jgi:hypothetical protein
MVADQYGSGTRLLDASLNTGGDTKLEQAKRLQTQHSFVVSYPLGVLLDYFEPTRGAMKWLI